MATSHTIVDNTGNASVFSPSIFSQVQQKLSTGDYKSDLAPIESEYKLDPEDLEGIVEMPFDCAAFLLKYEAMGLTPEQSRKLCKVWVKPMQKLLGKYPKADLIIAVSATMAIIAEKSIEYTIERDRRTGSKGKRENKLPEAPAPNGETVVHSGLAE